LSLYFKTHRDHYYQLLQSVRTEGAWNEWLSFFLEGTEATARQAAETAVELLRLFSEDRKRIQALGRPASSALRLHEFLQKRPLMTIAAAADELQLSIPTVTAAVRHLMDLEIVREATGRSRNRIFAYQRYLLVASEGTEPLRPSLTPK
jgi:Fic family protein